MKTILNIKISPLMIVSSVVFWAIVVTIVYLGIFWYFFSKAFIGDSVLHVDEAATTYIVWRINGRIYRMKVKPVLHRNKPLAKN